MRKTNFVILREAVVSVDFDQIGQNTNEAFGQLNVLNKLDTKIEIW
jgi:hypothetical protein